MPKFIQQTIEANALELWTDAETGVQYLNFYYCIASVDPALPCCYGNAVTPRLNADGSLHIDFEALQEAEENEE